TSGSCRDTCSTIGTWLGLCSFPPMQGTERQFLQPSFCWLSTAHRPFAGNTLSRRLARFPPCRHALSTLACHSVPNTCPCGISCKMALAVALNLSPNCLTRQTSRLRHFPGQVP